MSALAWRRVVLMAVVASMFIGLGDAYFQHRVTNGLGDRVTKIERVIRCQDVAGCRDFIIKAIRAELARSKSGKTATFRVVPKGVVVGSGHSSPHGLPPAPGIPSGPVTTPTPSTPGVLDPTLHAVCSIADHLAHLC